MGILSWIIVGAIAGWLAGYLMKSSSGLLGNIVLGIIGGIVGGWVLGLAGIGAGMNGFSIESVLTATLGAVILIGLGRMLTGRRAT
jgi:uncharacterized membrane protein YeaQ/YmgE (transglycosylase-associated protein family)